MSDPTEQKTQETAATSTTLEITRKNFGQMLLECRLEREMTIAAAADMAHIKHDTLRQLESGDINAIKLHPHYAQAAIEKLCNAYNKSAEPIVEAFSIDAYAQQLHEHDGVNGNAPIPADDEADSAATQHRVAQTLIIAVFIAVLGLIVVGRFYKGYQERHQQATQKFDLTELLPLEPPPMEVLAIP